MKETKPQVLAHEYDGICEYDNPTPGWWHLIFVGSVVFAGMYMVFWHFSPLAWSEKDAWKSAQVREYKRIFGAVGDLKNDVPTLIAMKSKPEMMAIAEGMYIGNCAQCHAKDGGGVNGVNLTDNSYKNVKEMTDVFTVITNGAANGAMPSWRALFSENERVLLAAYVSGLRGTTPANPKPPEGNEIAAWPVK
ncbi:MAG: c-type cytochrome [Planctomycetes bacterium]|nr:c-type cytochrome [Planctomycetota bacterium]